eukprot:636383-Prorocentrum_minimum.AAC.2
MYCVCDLRVPGRSVVNRCFALRWWCRCLTSFIKRTPWVCDPVPPSWARVCSTRTRPFPSTTSFRARNPLTTVHAKRKVTCSCTTEHCPLRRHLPGRVALTTEYRRGEWAGPERPPFIFHLMATPQMLREHLFGALFRSSSSTLSYRGTPSQSSAARCVSTLRNKFQQGVFTQGCPTGSSPRLCVRGRAYGGSAHRHALGFTELHMPPSCKSFSG